MKFGLDVSHHNGKLDFTKFDKDFVIIRAGYGKSVKQIDKEFINNITNAKKNGVKFGVYWYSYATTVTETIEEVATFHSVIRNYVNTDTPIFYDIEEPTQAMLSNANLNSIINAFVNTARNYGYTKIGIYSSDSWYSRFTITDTEIIKWVARIGHEPINKYDIFQYSWKEKSKINNCDFDCNKCSDDTFDRIFDTNFNDSMDIDGDGKITAHDSLCILQRVVGLKGGENIDG